ncbi:MAG: ATP-dependent metallopeptidase FtsH/Yme1/Tma family protein [Campylobacterales bacterium]|nr:ATP-dependent metallopeptidase FtsH/Yme1/Tma family protein [Campylobacterales bacterium]
MKKAPVSDKPFNPFSNSWLVILFLILGLEFFYYFASQGESQTLSYTQFKSQVEANSIKEIWIDNDRVTALLKDETGQPPKYIKTILPPFKDEKFLELLEKKQVDIHVKSQKESKFLTSLFLMLPFFALGLN